MALQSASYRSPVGVLHIVARDSTVLALNLRSFSDAMLSLSESIKGEELLKVAKIKGVTDLLDDYFDGDLKALNPIKTSQPGGDFSQSAWKAIRKVRGGEVATYAELAEMIGRPRAMRAAGTACGKNKIAIIIPCHRIVKSDGTIGNYGYGIATKVKLLAHEGIDY